MNKDDKNIEIDIKRKMQPENKDKTNQNQQQKKSDKNLNTNNNQENILPALDDEEKDDEEKDDEEKDDEENDDEENDDEENDDDEEKNDNSEDTKENRANKDDIENGDNKYNNSQDRKNLNPDRSQSQETNPSSKVSNSKEGAAAGAALAGKAKNALENKLMSNDNIKKAQKAAETVSTLATNSANFFVTLFQTLINPIAWIGLGIFIVTVIVFAFGNTLGQNDFNIMCDDSGIGSISIDSDADDFTRQSAIASWMTSTPFAINGGQPLTNEQAAGIIGNLITESYGANPKAIQNDTTTTQWQTCDNNCVLGWGSVGGKAVGIVQWDRGRRIELVNFAKQEGTQWHDLTTQLKFLKTEMESGYERDQLVRGGFNEIGKSVADYTKIWNVYFERSAKAGTPAGDNPRIANAEQFASSFTGGSFSFSGLSDNCVGGNSGLFSGGGIDTSSLVQLAIQSAHPRRSSALERCGNNLTNCGQNTATDTYKKAKITAEAATSKDPIPGLLASCDRFVATMYRATGKDPNFPWGATAQQIAYMRNNPDWEQISCDNRQPGDVLWAEGHTMLYVGMVNGTDSIASASLGHRSGNLSRMRCQGSDFIADGYTAIGFRKVR